MRQRLSPRDTIAVVISGTTIVPGGRSRTSGVAADATCEEPARGWPCATSVRGVEAAAGPPPGAGGLRTLSAAAALEGEPGGGGACASAGPDGACACGAAATCGAPELGEVCGRADATGAGTLKTTSARDFTAPETGSTSSIRTR